MWLMRFAGVAVAAAAAGVLFAPQAARAQPLEKQLYWCIVQDRDNAVNYITLPFEAIEQPRSLFYANQFREFVQQNYSVGSLDREQIGCNGTDDSTTREEVLSNRNEWLAKPAQSVALNWRPREEAPAPRTEEVVIDPRGNVAALAIDRRSGDRYGWAIDYESQADADARALAECMKFGADCHIVLRFTGGCGAYAVQQGSDAVYGWGTNTDRNAAEHRAREEVRKRGGTMPVIRVWGCNSVRPEPAAQESALPADTPVAAPADLQEREAAALNKRITQANAEVERRNAAAKAEFDAAQAKFEAARAKYEAEAAAHRAEVAAADAARQQYETDRRAWEAKVAACNAGDVASCAP